MRNETEYFLMHKDIPVCLMEVHADGTIGKVRRNPSAADHFPLGGQMNDMKFHEWWKDRAIPKTRNGAPAALQRLGYASTGTALIDNLALSLSDCYWIKPRYENLTWKDVNLFQNDFTDAFGELTIHPDSEIDLRNDTRFRSAASQGELQKKWCIDNKGRRFLVKGNYGMSYQQSINELFASRLHRQQGFSNYTEYRLVDLKTAHDAQGLGCMCYDFCSNEAESISAWELLQTRKLRNNQSFYQPLKEICMSLGMTDETFTDFMDYEIMTDYLLTNTDRHMNNIAVLRNPDTLKLIGFAPIYDSGNSMFYSTPYESLQTIRLDQINTHSFVERETRLLQYVRNRNAVDISKTDMDFSIYEKDIKERQIRIPLLKELYCRKQESLYAFQQGHDIWKDSRYSA